MRRARLLSGERDETGQPVYEQKVKSFVLSKPFKSPFHSARVAVKSNYNACYVHTERISFRGFGRFYCAFEAVEFSLRRLRVILAQFPM